MNYTNKHHLPDYLVRILSNEWYSGANAKHDFSVTGFNQPVPLTILEQRHKDEIQEDVADTFVQLLGVGFHSLSEQALKDDIVYQTEKRNFILFDGYTISGQYDLYIPSIKTLVDYKVTKASSFIYGTKKDDYNLQMNLNKYILKQHDIEVKNMHIVELYRDYSKGQEKYNSAYPPSGINIIECDEYTDAVVEYKVAKFIQEYNRLKNLPDNMLPPCSPEERWEKGGEYAVMKQGGKRALKLFKTKNEAEIYRNNNCDMNITFIEKRPVELTRCNEWCRVNQWCPFYQAHLQGIKQEAINENNKGNQATSDKFKDIF